MNILYLANVRLPTEKAHGLQIMKTCEALAGAGADVTLLTPTRKNSIRRDLFEYYGVAKNFTHEIISAPSSVSSLPGFLFSLLWFSEAARHTKAFNRSDVVYSRDHLILLQYILLGHPFVFEAHQAPNFFSSFVARMARKVVVISRSLKEVYEKAGVRESKIIVAPDAVEYARFAITETKEEAREKLSIPQEKAVALYVGHLYARKGAGILAQAAQAIPNVLAVFVGGTEEDIRAFKVRWGKESNITIVGYQPPEKIPLFLRAADVLVLPNSALNEDSARFSSPMKLFEYMASGTPIVASDVPALREILSDSSASFVKPDDPQALAQGITSLLGDPVARQKSKEAQIAAGRYSWIGRAKLILSALSSCI